MKKRLFIRPTFAILLVVIALLGVLVVVLSATKNADDFDKEQKDAVLLMEEAEKYLKEEILSRGIEIEEEDLNKTALLGPEFTELTSTPGEVGAKRSVLNPYFAAAMIRYFREAGLKRGDKIAISTSGSFPGFVIATLIASKVYGLDVYLTASVGASMHGATRVEYNIFDIIKALRDGGFASYHLVGVSCGSKNDQGGSVLEGILYEGTPELSYELCKEASLWSGAEIIHYENLTDSIRRHLELLGEDVKMFINIGGASVNSGTSAYTLDFPQGLVLDPPKIPEGDNIGLNYEYAKRGIPVLNLLNVKKLCQDNSISFDPFPLPKAEDYASYTQPVYSKTLIAVFLSLFFITLIIAVVDSKVEIKEDKKDKRKERR